MKNFYWEHNDFGDKLYLSFSPNAEELYGIIMGSTYKSPEGRWEVTVSDSLRVGRGGNIVAKKKTREEAQLALYEFVAKYFQRMALDVVKTKARVKV